MTITPTDADIAEALRLSGYHASFFDLSKIDVGATWGGAIRAHAQTIAEKRVAVEALEKLHRCYLPIFMTMAEREMCEEPIPDSAVILQFMGSGSSDQVTAGELREADALTRQALAQIKGTDHD